MAIKRFTAEEQRLKKCERERLRRLNNPEKKRASDAAYRAANRDKVIEYGRDYFAVPENAERNRDRVRAYYAANKEKCKAAARERYYSEKEHVTKMNSAWRAKNMARVAANKRRKYNTNPQVKLAVRVRSRLARAIRRECRHKTAIAMLGCTVDELKAYIESLFKPGMTWANWSFRGWHLDHIKPLEFFDLTDPKQLEQACHFTNLQPLWMSENLTKGRKPPRPVKGAAVA